MSCFMARGGTSAGATLTPILSAQPRLRSPPPTGANQLNGVFQARPHSAVTLVQMA